MARDRKRARQRRRVPQLSPTPDSPPLRENVPGSLQHTGDVDEFDAALVRGARPQGDLNDELAGLGEESAIPETAGDESVGDPFAEPSAATRRRRGGGSEAGEAVERPSGAAAARRPPGNRALAFLRASWAELQRVQWPDRRQVAQATAVVLGFVVVAGVYLGAADWVAQKVVNFVL